MNKNEEKEIELIRELKYMSTLIFSVGLVIAFYEDPFVKESMYKIEVSKEYLEGVLKELRKEGKPIIKEHEKYFKND